MMMQCSYSEDLCVTIKKIVNFFEEKSASLIKTCVLRATTKKEKKVVIFLHP